MEWGQHKVRRRNSFNYKRRPFLDYVRAEGGSKLAGGKPFHVIWNVFRKLVTDFTKLVIITNQLGPWSRFKS